MSQSKLNRREFVGGMAALGLAVPLSGMAAQGKSKSQVAKGRPLMVATWKQGKPANEKAAEVLAAGGSLLDALEKGINIVELDPDIMSVGYGAYPNEDGVVSLDAVIMDGATHRAGAVGALEKIATPISVARRVMEKTYHTFLAGEHALRFALEEGFEPQQLLTPKALEAWMKWKADPNRKFHRRGDPSRRYITRPEPQPAAALATPDLDDGDTITMAILDAKGNLAAGGSTSGLRWKVPGRVGDVPLIGSGIFVDNTIGAAGATGDGDEMQKFCTSVVIVERMRNGLDPQSACESVLQWILDFHPETKEIEACVYAVSKKGEYGAASIRPGDFTYAVWEPGVSELRKAPSIL